MSDHAKKLRKVASLLEPLLGVKHAHVVAIRAAAKHISDSDKSELKRYNERAQRPLQPMDKYWKGDMR